MKQMNSNPGIMQIGPQRTADTPKQKEEPMIQTSDDQSKSFIKYLYHLRPTEFKVEDFVSVIDDSSLMDLEKNKELSPNTKLRILQRKLESQRKLNTELDGEQIDRPLPVFHGFKSGKNKGLVLDSRSASTASYQKKIRNFSASQNITSPKRPTNLMGRNSHMVIAVEPYEIGENLKTQPDGVIKAEIRLSQTTLVSPSEGKFLSTQVTSPDN